jgi:hypothetical protein
LLQLQFSHIIAQAQHVPLVLMMPCMHTHNCEGLHLARSGRKGPNSTNLSRFCAILHLKMLHVVFVHQKTTQRAQHPQYSVYNMAVLRGVTYDSGAHLHAVHLQKQSLAAQTLPAEHLSNETLTSHDLFPAVQLSCLTFSQSTSACMPEETSLSALLPNTFNTNPGDVSMHNTHIYRRRLQRCVPSGVKYIVPLSMAASGKNCPSPGSRVRSLMSDSPSSQSPAGGPCPPKRLLLPLFPSTGV